MLQIAIAAVLTRQEARSGRGGCLAADCNSSCLGLPSAGPVTVTVNAIPGLAVVSASNGNNCCSKLCWLQYQCFKVLLSTAVANTIPGHFFKKSVLESGPLEGRSPSLQERCVHSVHMQLYLIWPSIVYLSIYTLSLSCEESTVQEELGQCSINRHGNCQRLARDCEHYQIGLAP